ncbi:MAG: type II secretion system F family protein, partial [Candidatus Methanomethylicus sp.]|nr:type II secretion system F family protein [Candidatus Methanomethylicus sp.]
APTTEIKAPDEKVKEKDAKPDAKPKKKSTFAFPDVSVFAYRHFGKLALKIAPKMKGFNDTLWSALMRTTVEKYVSKMLFISLLALIITPIVTFPFVYKWFVLMYAIFMSIGLGVLAGAITFLVMYIVPSYTARTRKNNVEKSLNFATQYMAILAGAEVTPERIFKSILTADIDKVIKDEIAEVVKGIDIFGEDFYTALNNRINKTPSKKLADLMKGVLAVGSMGGDLRRYLHMQGKIFMRERKIDLKRQLDQLGVTAEIYISMGVVLPLIIIVMLATMSFIGSAGIDALMFMYIVTFVLIPGVSALMLLVIDQSVPKEE